MRTIERRFNETELEFVERVNTVMMDDFASELMKQGKTGTEGVTISYQVRKDDWDVFDLDDLFYYECYDSDEEYTYIYVSTSCEEWEAWDKARETAEEWIIEIEDKTIFNVVDDRELDASEVWWLILENRGDGSDRRTIYNRLIRTVVADDILRNE